jgi:hypothetical protein
VFGCTNLGHNNIPKMHRGSTAGVEEDEGRKKKIDIHHILEASAIASSLLSTVGAGGSSILRDRGQKVG